MAEFDIKINSLELEALIKKYNFVGSKLGDYVERGVNKGIRPIERLLKNKYLNGVILKVVTNRLRGSTRAWVHREVNTVFGIIGSPVKYAPPHEFGYTGLVDVSSYIRSDGVSVQAHSKYLNIPERAPFRKAVRDRRREFLKILMAEIMKGFKRKG